MKLNVATLLLAISAASPAHARATPFLRDPRTVEEKEQVQRQTMGDHVPSSVSNTLAGGKTCKTRVDEAAGVDPTDEEKSLACWAVSKEFPDCLGCQGYSLMGKEVHIPGCIDMTVEKCMLLAQGIVEENQSWFKFPNAHLLPDQHEIFPAVEMAYYKLGLPVKTNSDGDTTLVGVAGNCVVEYPYDWCVLSSNGDTACIKLQPWDCSKVAGDSTRGCLSTYECCAKIQGEYPKPDINNNELQCYSWELPEVNVPKPTTSGATTGPGPTGTGPTGTVGPSGVGNRLVIHTSGGKVALPAVLTDDNHEVGHEEDIIHGPATYYIGYDTGGCLEKNELGPRTVSVVEECAAACDKESSCVSFEYKKTGAPDCKLSASCDKHALTVQKSSDDYMWYLKVTKDATRSDNPSGKAYLWVLDNVLGNIRHPQGLTNMKYYFGYSSGGCVGMNMDKFTKPGVEACAEACSANSACISFEYKKEGTGSPNCMLSKDCEFGLTENDPANDYMFYEKFSAWDTKHKQTNGDAYLWLMNN